MKNFIKNTVIAQAIELGFDFEIFTTDTDLSEINEALIDFFNENMDQLEEIEDECEVTNNGRTQYVEYGDFWADGELVDFHLHRHKSPDTKIYHSDFVMIDTDGLAKKMNLYYLVGETEENAPEGFGYSRKDGCWVKL